MIINKNKIFKNFESKYGALTFGQMINSLRVADEFSQIDLAKKMKISRAMLCDIEKGRRVVSLKTAKKFAKVLGYSEEQFVTQVLQDMARSVGYNAEIQLKSVA